MVQGRVGTEHNYIQLIKRKEQYKLSFSNKTLGKFR